MKGKLVVTITPVISYVGVLPVHRRLSKQWDSG